MPEGFDEDLVAVLLDRWEADDAEPVDRDVAPHVIRDVPPASDDCSVSTDLVHFHSSCRRMWQVDGCRILEESGFVGCGFDFVGDVCPVNVLCDSDVLGATSVVVDANEDGDTAICAPVPDVVDPAVVAFA